MHPSADEVQQRLNYKFSRPQLLARALRHASAGEGRPDAPPHNEPLAFVGDAVLGLLVAEMVYEWDPTASKGSLTDARKELVSNASLNAIAAEARLAIEDWLTMGEGERKVPAGKERRGAMGFEALIGAVFLDGNFDEARNAFRPILERYHKRDGKPLDAT